MLSRGRLRVKLATELSSEDTGKTIYILDEPTAAHFADVHKLIEILQKLASAGKYCCSD